MKLGKEINDYLERTGTKAKDFAKAIGVSTSMVSNYRRNVEIPKERQTKILSVIGKIEPPKVEEVEYISAEEASERMCIPVRQMKEGLKQQIFPFNTFGYAIQFETSNGYRYMIFKRKFTEFLDTVKS